ncbi:hypothetical protein V6N11_072896 [Hibiscus sabdariffa]|uniref:Uncharacterized protein n=1 Tax=Hibiscus sabdariffa TaxID=183260 RepID=A0ABR2P0R0_9ROSI
MLSFKQSKMLNSKENVALEPSSRSTLLNEHKVERQDKDKLSYSYNLIEDGPLGGKLEKIFYENKFVGAVCGGSVCKSLMKFYTISDCIFTEEEIKDLNERMYGVYKNVEAYLLANHEVYMIT